MFLQTIVESNLAKLQYNFDCLLFNSIKNISQELKKFPNVRMSFRPSKMICESRFYIWSHLNVWIVVH
jgi:hypothetical protein